MNSLQMNSMRFITGIEYSKSALMALNSITFIFDPNWEVGNSDVPTFPVCFFQVKNIHEVMEADISQKTALFYNDNSMLSSSGLKGAMTNVVADNIVIKPKQYKMDIIIPFDILKVLTSQYGVTSFSSVANTIVSGSGRSDLLFNKFQSYANMVTPVYTILENLIKSLLISNNLNVNLKDFINNVMGTPDYNKNSLEAMWLNRGILKMKMWNGWRYKYVAITGLDISKEPTEKDVYEASLTVQEVPILTFRKSVLPTTPSYVNPILTATGKAVISALDEKGV